MKEPKFKVGDKVNRKLLKKYKGHEIIGKITKIENNGYFVREEGEDILGFMSFDYDCEYELYIPWIYQTKKFILSLFRKRKKKNKSDKFRNQVAVSMMQALLINKNLVQYEGAYGKVFYLKDNEIAAKAVKYADALIEELKKED